MVRFTQDCEKSLSLNTLKQLQRDIQVQLDSYTKVDVDRTVGPAACVLELKLKSLIMDTIHIMDVVQSLMDAGCQTAAEWVWQKQLR